MPNKNTTDYWLDSSDMSFKGDFETMYQEVSDPWGCLAHKNSLNNKLFIEMIFHGNQYDCILDIGSGLGGLTNTLAQKQADVTGWDISIEAVKKARLAYPLIKFEHKNLMLDAITKKYNLIVVSEVLWYLLDDINNVFQNISSGLTKGGVLAIHQYFPTKQNFGKDMIEGIDGFEKFIATNTKFKFVKKIVCHEQDGKVMLCLLQRNS